MVQNTGFLRGKDTVSLWIFLVNNFYDLYGVPNDYLSSKEKLWFKTKSTSVSPRLSCSIYGNIK